MNGHVKVIQSGDHLEVFEYEKAYIQPKKVYVRKPRVKGYFKRHGRLSNNIRKLKQSFIRLVWANIQRDNPPALLTLTMLQIMEVSAAYKELTAFFNRLRQNSRVGKRFRYIAVPEFQKRGAVHFHVLVWDFPKSLVDNEATTRYIQRQWLRGFCDIVWTDGSVKLAGYLAKYMSKAMQDERLLGQRAYSPSRNVMRPVSVSGTTLTAYIDQIMGVDKSLVHEAEYSTMWLGRANYKQYLRI